MTIFPGFIKKYNELIESPAFSKEEDRPESIREIPPEIVEGIRGLTVNAIREGIPMLTKDKITISTYDRFRDAIGSKIAGKVNLNLGYFAIKVGNISLKQQVDFFECFKNSPFKTFFPNVYEIDQLEDKQFAYLMEHLTEFLSLHDLIFKEMAVDINKRIEILFNVLSDIYKSFKKPGVKPDLKKLYLDRIHTRVEEAKDKFGDQTLTSDYKFIDIFDLDVETKQGILISYNKIMKKLSSIDIELYAPHFTTLIHGDSHPGNIMFGNDRLRNFKFIDPNGSLRQSDYMYDLGKFFHWIDLFGFISLERDIEKQLINVDVSKFSDGVEIKYDFSPLKNNIANSDKLMSIRDSVIRFTQKKFMDLIKDFGDKTGEMRLNLSIASAYFGGLTHQTEATHLAILFVEGLKHLNKFVLDTERA